MANTSNTQDKYAYEVEKIKSSGWLGESISFVGDPRFLGRYSAKWSEQEQPTMSLYEVYIINLATYDTLSELVVADSEAKAHIKAFAQAGLGGSSVDDYHFICRRIGDVPSGEE